MLNTHALCRRVACCLTTGALLLAGATSTVAAQANGPCPFTNDGVVSPALGSPVQGYADPGTPPGYDICEFGDYTLIRQGNANPGGLAGLAQNIVLGLPAEVAAQVGGLDTGKTLDLPGYQIGALSGLGDAALWVKDSKLGVDALVVQRGNDVFAFQVLDRPDARAKMTALAQAVVANAAPTATAGAPSGDRPAVIADCMVDVANAVADKLPRADVSTINIIGGCHYVAIATTLDGNGFANATTAQQICDIATEVAYANLILGITVTDRGGHERASGADGQPCSGFP